MKQLIINHLNRSKRMAVCENDKLEQLIYLDSSNESMVGNIYIGVIERVLVGMNAAFVHIGQEKKGFLPLHKMANYAQMSADEKKHPQALSSSAFVGKKIIVQVEADATKTKGPKLTELVEINQDNLVFIKDGNYTAISKKITDKEVHNQLSSWSHSIRLKDGMLLRTNATEVSLVELERQFNNAKMEIDTYVQLLKNGKVGLVKSNYSVKQSILDTAIKFKVKEIITDDIELVKQLSSSSWTVSFYQKAENIFSAYQIEDKIDKALKRVVWLENGAYLIIDEVEALTIIDVNTGAFLGKNSIQETAFKTNRWALEESFRQIQLRNLSGMILIDFIEMTPEQREVIEKEAVKLASNDAKRVRIAGFTSLGILQMTRKKTSQSLLEQTTILCPTCNGQSRVKSAEEVAHDLERELFGYKYSDHEKVLIDCSKDVYDYLVTSNQETYNSFLQLIQKEVIITIQEGSKPFYKIRQLI